MKRQHKLASTDSCCTRRVQSESRGRRRGGYVLLETVIAVGLLLLGLTMIGTQVQEARQTVRKMDLRVRARMLAEMHLAHLDLGLIELESVDDVEEDVFGPRYPHFAWQTTIDDTAIEGMYLLRLDVLYHVPLDEDEEDQEVNDEQDFAFEESEVVYTIYTMKPAPVPVNIAEDFGLTEEEFEELAAKLSDLGIEGIDAEAFDPAILARLDFEELVEVLPPLLEAFGMPLDSILGSLPPDVRQAIIDSGVLSGDALDGGTEDGSGGGPGGGQ